MHAHHTLIIHSSYTLIIHASSQGQEALLSSLDAAVTNGYVTDLLQKSLQKDTMGAAGADRGGFAKFKVRYTTVLILYTVYSYTTVLILCTHTVCSYCVLILCTHTVLIHRTHTPYSYTVLIHRTHTPYSYTVPTLYSYTIQDQQGGRGHHCTHTVCSYTTSSTGRQRTLASSSRCTKRTLCVLLRSRISSPRTGAGRTPRRRLHGWWRRRGRRGARR
jgi:hypothetical protein